jgi:hypothetical protein
VDRFWIFERSEREGRDPVIIRLRYNAFAERAILEIATEQADVAEQCLRTIIDHSVEHSVYRNQLLELAFEAGTKDEYGDVERPERLRVLFKAVEPVADSDIVIDEAVRQMLWRNVVDLHLRRAVLKANGVPVRRGVLLYGPPGTGKTFACREQTVFAAIAGSAKDKCADRRVHQLCGRLERRTRALACKILIRSIASM